MSNLHATNSMNAMRPRHRSPFIVGGVAVCIIVGLVIAAISVWSPQATKVAGTGDSSSNSMKVTPEHEQPKPRAIDGGPSLDDKRALVEDDGRTLWASPTDGAPLNLAYLPPGAQLIVALRTSALAKHPENEKVRAALGPVGARAIELVQQSTHVPLESMDQLVAGFQPASDGNWDVTLVASIDDAAARRVVEQLAEATPEEHEGQIYHVVGEQAYYFPTSKKNGKVLVVAPVDAITDIIDLAGDPPPLRRDIERLLAHTHADRHVTMVVAPNTLFNEGQTMFAGEMAGLRDPLFWFLSDELSAAALSMHWDENFFVELIATPTLDTSPERAARILTERMTQMPSKLEEYFAAVNLSTYSEYVVRQLPQMLHMLTQYTRSSFAPDHAVLRCYLPAVAGHNLLMAAELTLAQTSKAVGISAEAPSTPAPVKPQSLTEQLKRPTSLQFARDTLEAAVEQLAADIGVAIEIDGPALQADGITKNQSLAINLENKPAEEILIEILRMANPDKTATAVNDPRQKLVYVIAKSQAGAPNRLLITTRAAVAERGIELPQAFRPK